MASQRKNEAIEKHLDDNANKMLYVPLEETEPLERYRLGGYHPVRIGDRYHKRYQIVHKLGYGTSSTTWLARNEETATYVAIKITVPDPGSPSESDILRLLWGSNNYIEAHPGKLCLPPLLDEFEIRGPNGSHPCLVTTPARMSVSEAREASFKRIFQLPVARAIAAQLIEAVAFLHSRGVVHCDLHEGNILLCLPKSIDSLTPEQLYESYEKPEMNPVERLDGQPLGIGVPSYGVVPIWLGGPCEDVAVSESCILLTDFSESFQPAKTTRFHSHMPLILRAPEQYFAPSIPLSFPADIWALGCAIFAILGQRPLFETWFPTNDRVIEEQVDTLGYPPSEWWTRWPSRSSFFDDELRRSDGAPRRPLEARFEYSIQEPRREFGMIGIDQHEKKALYALLKSMLAFKPEHRPLAQQVLESEWMTKWARQDLESTRS